MFLRYLSAKPHVAASPRNNELANEYERRFNAYGFDEVEKLTYNVLLSYPNQSQPNYAYIMNNTNGVNFRTKFMEDILDPAENSPEAYQPFNAFGLAATVTVSIRNAVVFSTIDPLDQGRRGREAWPPVISKSPDFRKF